MDIKPETMLTVAAVGALAYTCMNKKKEVAPVAPSIIGGKKKRKSKPKRKSGKSRKSAKKTRKSKPKRKSNKKSKRKASRKPRKSQRRLRRSGKPRARQWGVIDDEFKSRYMP